VDSYFKNVMDNFSLPDQEIASSAFNHLVTPRGTKMAYPVKDLSGLLRLEEEKLEDVLERLRKSRILRTRKREGVLWYELYHDIFSSIIHAWNEKFKARQRRKKTFIIASMVILAAAFLFVIYDFIRNSTGRYLRLSPKTGISDTIEIYRGKPWTWDIFNKNQYLAETSFQRYDVEADKRFDIKQTGDFNELNVELIGLLPVYRRVSEYYNNGEIKKATDLLGKFLSSYHRDIREYFRSACPKILHFGRL
jgi:hypothetical protein